MRWLPDHFRFEQPGWFWLLALLPLLAVLRAAAGRQSAVAFSSLHILRDLGRATQSAIGKIALWALFATFIAATIALARPQSVRTEERVDETGVEIFMVLDLSLSMSIEDMFFEDPKRGRIKVDRLTVAKKVVRDFIKNRPSDRIGFVVFSGRPYLASPLTLDKNWLADTLENIWFNQTPDMGTAIGSALATAGYRLKSRDSKSKTIILITDGANNSGKISPKDAATNAAKLGVKIYTVAIGTYGFHQVPVPSVKGERVGVKQEFDEQTLKDVASIGGGRFYHARDTGAMEDIFREIDRLEKSRLNVRRTTHIDELYHYPLWAALSTGLLGLVWSHSLGRRFP
jgi:Ca-activated chloride channel homolog